MRTVADTPCAGGLPSALLARTAGIDGSATRICASISRLLETSLTTMLLTFEPDGAGAGQERRARQRLARKLSSELASHACRAAPVGTADRWTEQAPAFMVAETFPRDDDALE